ncbi:MAG: hypothetical protein HYX28_07060 [Candidatus Koribacter versatilis]|uniref:Tetratricopeptide repeat protein n=1 Tax=Candidatus Korobacter versatilis TaxID=658062 RepID=A0A932EPU2_9BACT|nr:hypothetical protein [Candidatus Koribacter versatilis]
MRFRWLAPSVLALFVILFLAAAQPAARAQIVSPNLPAGTPADQDLQAIAKETDAARQKTMYADFVAKYAADPMATAYGYSQLAQLAFAAGDARQAMEFGDKSLAAEANNLDMLVSQVQFAQNLKLADKIVEYAARGGKVVQGIGTQPKPAGMSDEQFAGDNDQQRRSSQQAYDFLQAAAFSAITTEADPDKRWAEVSQFDAAFPKSQFSEQTAQLAMYALQQKGDYAQLAQYGGRVADANPQSLPILGLLAGMLAEDPKRGYDTAALSYARKAADIAAGMDLESDSAKKLAAGMAHAAIGWVYMKQEKTSSAIGEFSVAAKLVEENPAAYSTVLYRLGYAYAKQKDYASARATLNKGAAVKGPYQGESKKLLTKVNSIAPR